MVRKLGHAVLVETNVEAKIPRPFALVDDVSVDAILDTLVANRTYVLCNLVETSRWSYRYVEEQTGIVGVIHVERHVDAVDECEVDTYSSHVSSLPVEQWVSQTAWQSSHLILVESRE